jgi:choice-of-anchor B domain-containing protein
MTRDSRSSYSLLLALALIGPGAGSATAQTSQNIIFHANLHEHAEYNDIWGYTAPNGDEYALLGTNTGTAVINVVDPDNPYETGFIPGPTSIWRDIKTYNHYAYVTNETSGGLEIIDLADPENPVDLPNYTGFTSAHNLYIDTTTARCYIAGSNLVAGGARILSLANPTAPVEIGFWETAYLHDIMVQDDILYGSAINNARLYILDVSNPASIATLAQKGSYPNAFTHNAWVTPDGNYVMTTDETAGAACRMWDITNLPTVTETDNYLPNAFTIPHNAHIDGDLAVISHYTLGVRVVDVSDPFNLVELGYYDTWPATDGGTYDGCWGAYPFFTTNPDLIVASDISTGLYVLEYKGPLGTVTGTVTDASAPSVTIEDADVEIVETGIGAQTDVMGQYTIQDVAGSVNLQVSAFAYQTATVPVTITTGSTAFANVALTPVPGGSISGTVTDAQTSGPVPNATVEILSTPLLEVSDAAGDYDHASVPAGSYTVRIHAFGYNEVEVPVTVGIGTNVDLDVPLHLAPVAFDFEIAGGGWTVSGSVVTGAWELGDPEPTSGGTVQPGDDHTPSPGTDAWVTGLLAGTGVGSYDVDGGATVLTSPALNAAGMNDPHVSYWRWYQTGAAGNPASDFWVVEVSSDGGASWTKLEETDQGAAEWVNVDEPISAYVTPTVIVQFRFTAQDTGAGSITEAVLDDFMIYDRETLAGTGTPSVSPAAAAALSLGPSAPNPFRPGQAASLRFTLPQKGDVAADVFDVAGRRVATIARGMYEAGGHTLVWDGRVRGGSPAPAGVYFLRLQTEAGERSRKMLLMR